MFPLCCSGTLDLRAFKTDVWLLSLRLHTGWLGVTGTSRTSSRLHKTKSALNNTRLSVRRRMATGQTLSKSMCELSVQEEMAYSGELHRAVQADFIACIPAVELMDVECISDKLTDEEMQRVKTKCDMEGPRAAARLLLASLARKRHWFQAFMQALDCRYLRLQDFRPKFLQLKEKVDKEWMARHSSHSDAASLCSADAASSSPPTRGGRTQYQQHACNKQDRASGTEEDTECKAVLVPSGPVTERRQVQGCRGDNGSDDDNQYDLFRGPDLHKESWYHGSMECSQADNIMKDCCPGSFLVRYNVKHQHFCLSIVGHGQNLHLKIREEKEPGGALRYHLDTSRLVFGDIPSLVGFFMQHPVTTQTSADICLCRPIPKGQGDVLPQSGTGNI